MTGTEPFIEVSSLTVRFGDRVAVDNVSFSVGREEHLSLLGPSGCGKTTLLRCIAGFETPAAGTIRVGDRILFSSEKKINVPVQHRHLSMMFQTYAIWPHMTVFENVAYPLKIRRTPSAEIKQRVQELLAMVGLAEYANSPSTQLSGGQQQRVALARSYAFLPDALLLDEPLSNLDARLREQMRDDLAAMQRRSGVTTIYVTHDQEEAMSLSDRILVLSRGKIVQDGSPDEIYNRPRNSFVADFIGAANILTGTLATAEGRPMLTVGDTVLECEKTTVADGPRTAAVRNVYPVLTRTAPAGQRNVWPARVAGRTFLGDAVLLLVRWPGGEALKVRALPSMDLRVDDEVFLHIAPEHIVLLDDGDL